LCLIAAILPGLGRLREYAVRGAGAAKPKLAGRGCLAHIQSKTVMTMPLPMKIPLSRFITLALVLIALAPGRVSAADDAAKRWAQYEPSFQAFAELDAAKPPGKGGILFVGSSIFRQWTNVPEMMAPLPVLNRAFGGSRTGDQLARFDQLIPVYQPKVVVYYCGSNDLKANPADAPEVIFGRFREFSERLRKLLPATRLIYVTATRSPDRVKLWEQVDHYNALARAYCAATPHRRFIDLNPALVDASGHPRLDLYKDDKLHFHPPAYEAFTAIIRPVLEAVWREVQ
jgi:lysophospholipase L1-like esterase